MQNLEYRSEVPPVYKKLMRQLEKSLDLEGRELESNWASVQVIRHTGMLPDGPYPSYALALHTDSKCYPQGGAMVLFLHSTCIGGIRTISFAPSPQAKGRNRVQGQTDIHMAVGGAYFMDAPLFAKEQAVYNHGVKAHLHRPEDVCTALLLRFWAGEKDRRGQ